MNTSKSLALRGQLNTIIYEVTDSDDVVKQLADLLIPFITKREAAIVEAVEGLIEPDEPYVPVDIPTFVDPNDPHQWNLKVFSENQLKARLRQAIKEWQ